MSIERFFIIANRDKDKGQAFSYEIRDFLEGKGKVVVVQELTEGNHRGTEFHVLDTVLLFDYFI
jgi:hypothetical protein